MVDLSQITVVVPTRNERHNISRFLRSLAPGIALIIVDASSDETPELVAAERTQHSCVIRHPGNIPVARQIGADAAETPWLLFTDADVVFAEDYFERLAALDLQGCDLLYGPKLSHREYAWYYHLFSMAQKGMDHLGIPAASGSNLLIRGEALFEAGGFDPTLSCNEDSEVAWRVQRNGCCVRFEPGLRVFAMDHRRLQRGWLGKSLHSSVRGTLLYLNLMPPHWRRHDWGYWSRAAEEPTPSPAPKA